MNNTATIVGNLTRDPELKYTNSGIAFATFSIAVNEKTGEREETSYFDCIAWREMGENIAESLSKGSRVVAFGRFKQRSWDAEDGTKRSRVELTVDEVGPSLRWATASVTRTPSNGNTGGNAGGNAPRGGAAREPVAAGGGGDDEYNPFNPTSPF
jgi:single-strand DNA-binding protein